MPNQSKNAYGLTTLCPIIIGSQMGESYTVITRDRLQDLKVNVNSPMAKVPNTYLCRLFVLNDVIYEARSAVNEHLKSAYLVFSSNFHGTLTPYLTEMWKASEGKIREIWEFCVGFSDVQNSDDFVKYIKKCQVTTTFFFDGSTDDSLADQLKGLYLKQEFSKFAYANQGKSAADLQQAYRDFIARVQPANSEGPTWRAGAASLDSVVIND